MTPSVAEPTDAELVAAHRAGDRDAAGLLVVRHTGLVQKAVKLLGKLPGWIDRDDIVQAGRTAVWRSAGVGRWSPDQGSKFSTYAFQAVFNAVRREVRDQQRAAGRAESEVGDVPAAALADAADALDVGPLLNGCDPLGRRVLAGLFGLSGTPELPGQLARRVGVTTTQLRRLRDAALAAARAKAGAV